MAGHADSSPPWYHRWHITMDQIILLVLGVVTVVFVISYVNLLYQQHLAQQEKQTAERLLQEERVRWEQLVALQAAVQEPGYVLGDVARKLARGDEDTVVMEMPENVDEAAVVSAIQSRQAPRTIWRQWLERFHLGGVTP